MIPHSGLWILLLVLLAAGLMAYRITAGSAPKTFICRGCGGQFNHTVRTLKARKHAKSNYCNVCHKKWLDSRAPGGCALALVLIFATVASGLFCLYALVKGLS
jgi:hypothetical protein